MCIIVIHATKKETIIRSESWTIHKVITICRCILFANFLIRLNRLNRKINAKENKWVRLL